jgi:hypothetical protein
LNKPNVQKQKQEEAPLSAYDALQKKCNLDEKGFGSCTYEVPYDLNFEIFWDPTGNSIYILMAGNEDGDFYINFNNIELTLVRPNKKIFNFGYEFYFNTSCIPIVAGKKTREEYRKYESENPGQYFKGEAYVSPDNGMIYENIWDCQKEIRDLK